MSQRSTGGGEMTLHRGMQGETVLESVEPQSDDDGGDEIINEAGPPRWLLNEGNTTSGEGRNYPPVPIVESVTPGVGTGGGPYDELVGSTFDASGYGAIDTDLEMGGAPNVSHRVPFRQEALWSLLAFSFFGLLFATLLAFTISAPFQAFVVRNANALFTIPYVISFIVILACLAPWVPANAATLTQMNVGVIASVSDFLLVLLVLVEWAVCLALMLVTLVAVHDGLSYISVDGVIVPSDAPRSNGHPLPQPDTAVGGIAHNSPLILIVPMLTLYAAFNCFMHTFSCVEAIIRRRQGLSDTDVPDG